MKITGEISLSLTELEQILSEYFDMKIEVTWIRGKQEYTTQDLSVDMLNKDETMLLKILNKTKETST